MSRPSPKPRSSRRVGVDTGGTFTDLIELDGGRIRVAKVPSTPLTPERAVLRALESVDGVARGGRLIHGNTVGLNSVLTGQGARVALVTNKGFEDLIEIARQDRPKLYELDVPPRQTLVSRRLRFAIQERRMADGSLEGRATGKELARLGERIRRCGAEAIAVCLLHSFAHPEDEQRVARSLAGLGLPISISSDLLRRHREYERFSTALLNAYIQPVVSRYLGQLAEGASPMELYVLRNEGGSLPYRDALEHPVRTILSGPAGGALAARYWAKLCGFERALGFDMGGTSADVALPVEDEGVWDQATLGGHSLALPGIPLTSVGCGGGSIAYRDSGGALRVGPESAGADPGPAAYGRGTRPTVTDAHLFLGRLPASGLLGGRFPLDPGRAARAIEGLGRELGLDPRSTALGVLDVADLAMARPLRAFTMGRGLDPADFCLVASGGAGGLHALRLAGILGFGAVLVPPDPGILSAAGMLLARPVFERELAWVATLEGRAGHELASRARAFRDETRDLVARDHGRGRARVFASLRYRGNQAELWVKADGRARESFESEFEQRFGFLQELPIECLRIRARVTLERSLEDRLRNAAARATRSRPEGFPERCGPGGLRVSHREDLSSWREGPLAVLDYSGTTIVEEGWKAKLVDGGAILLNRA